MPTSVERGFLKLDGWDNAWGQRQLNQAFLKIDGVITNLENAATTRDFLKLEHSPSVRGAFDTVGDAFIKLGGDFGDIANVALKIDAFVVKLTSPATGSVTPAATVDGGGNPQTDFLKLDTALTTSGADLKLFGADFLKLDQSSDVSNFELKLGNLDVDLKTLGADTLNDGSAFNALGADFVTLGAGGATQTDQIYKTFGGDLKIIGSDFNALSSDFLKLDQALSNLGSGGGTPVTTASLTSTGPVGAAFATLNHDVLALSTDLHASAAPASGIISSLVRSFGGGGGAGFGDGGGSGRVG
jgi:hypothetical protein